MQKVTEKFLRYIKTDTQSDPNSESHPSTKKQFDLAMKLKKELEDIGLQNINLNEKCYLTATLPTNSSDKNIPTIGFIAHLDTAPDTSGANVKPKIVENYNGSDIVLDADNKKILSPKDFPELNNYIGQTLITTSGDTLLGADDKAGIAEIVTAMEYIIDNPEIKHGTIEIAFTPDEEIGQGAHFFDVEKFNAEYAFTVDGGEIGELEFENFNAAVANIEILGRNVHPGTAKNQMINSMHIATELDNSLPVEQRPEYTEGYEGFFHLTKITGTVDKTNMQYIIRDHNKQKFNQKKALFLTLVNLLNQKYGTSAVKIEIKDQYYNMLEKIIPVMHIVDKATKAIEAAGIQPKKVPIRGGTDGSQLSYKGLPCPNIFAGGHNFHGIYEYIPVQSMEKATEVIVNIVKEFTKK